MFRRQDRGWLRDGEQHVHPDDVEDSLKILDVYPGTMTGVIWPSLMRFDPAAVMKARRFKKMALARYAKQSLHEWGDKDAAALDEWFDSLVEVIKNEHPGSRSTED